MNSLIKQCFATLILCFVTCPTIVNASDISQCDYDDFLYGSGSIKIAGGVYTLEIGDEMNSYLFQGDASSPFVSQVQEAFAKAQENGSDILLLTSLDVPVCATTPKTQSLYIQSFLEKAHYYAVGVCEPETDNCWKMKIVKYSPATHTIKNGELQLVGQIATVIYADEKTIISIYTDEY